MSGRHRKSPRRRSSGRHRKTPPRSRWAVPAVAAVASVGFGGVAAATALGGGSGRDHVVQSPPHAAGIATDRATVPAAPVHTSPPAEPRPATHVAAVHVRRPVLVVVTIGRMSWVEVTGSGHRVLFQGLLRHGRRLTYSVHPLSVLLGDAGAVRLVVRGQVRQPAGRPGQVLVLHIR